MRELDSPRPVAVGPGEGTVSSSGAPSPPEGRHSAVEIQVVAAPREVDIAALRRWTERLVGALAPEADSLVVRLTRADEVRRLNETYRNRPEETDVLSFPGEESPEGSHLGDVVVAVPVAERQAAEADLPVATELERLVLHGVLHCLGYDHETDQGEMEALEARLRERWIEDRPEEGDDAGE